MAPLAFACTTVTDDEDRTIAFRRRGQRLDLDRRCLVWTPDVRVVGLERR